MSIIIVLALVLKDASSLKANPPDVRCPVSETLCMDVPNYPEDTIREIFRSKVPIEEETKCNQSGMNLSRDGARSVRRFVGSNMMVPFQIPVKADRQNRSACQMQTVRTFPKAGRKQDSWVFIVNVNDVLDQAITVEKCAYPDKPCFNLNGLFMSDYVTTRCDQKIVAKKLLAFDESTNETYYERFRIPVACVCYISTP